MAHHQLVVPEAEAVQPRLFLFGTMAPGIPFLDGGNMNRVCLLSSVRGSKSIPFRYPLVCAVLIATIILANAGFVNSASTSSSQKKGNEKATALRWNPPRVDSSLPSLAVAPPCALSDVLNLAGLRATELLVHLQNFIAHEQIRYAQADRQGLTELSLRAKFDYLVDFGGRSNPLNIRELRTALGDADTAQLSAVMDRGLPALALIFYPTLQTDYEMRCDGLTQWNDHPAWVVHFRQIKGKRPRTLTMYTTAEVSAPNRTTAELHPLSLKGRAWIAKDSGQVMHLETNLVDGILMIDLRENAFTVDYAPVRFQAQNLEIWLPQHAIGYTDYAKRRMIIEHTFSEFQLFSVRTDETIKKPSEP